MFCFAFCCCCCCFVFGFVVVAVVFSSDWVSLPTLVSKGGLNVNQLFSVQLDVG